ncbi:hypothetical protein TNCV_4807061 [Trichonephila clavipes]|nr:hypothetical protein TNCV_4807061 [Trichonephila clavipes]
MSPNTLRVHMEYVLVNSVGLKVLWAESRVQGTGEYLPLLQFHTKIVEVKIGGVSIYRRLFGNFTELNHTITCRSLDVPIGYFTSDPTNDRNASQPQDPHIHHKRIPFIPRTQANHCATDRKLNCIRNDHSLVN